MPLSAVVVSLLLAGPGLAQTEDFWEEPSKDEAAWINKNRRLPDPPKGGVEAQMTGRWGNIGYQESRLDNDGFVDYALKSCAPDAAYAVLHREEIPAVDRQALERLRKYLLGVQKGAVPYYTPEEFAKTVGSKDLAEAGLACRRALTDIEASIALDSPGGPVGSGLDRVAQSPKVLRLLENRRERKTFPEGDAGDRLHDLVRYKHLTGRNLFDGKDAQMMEIRCRLAQTLGAALDLFAQGGCDELWEE